MIYVVEQGDTLSSIADLYGISGSQIAYDNQILDQNRLVVGQALLLRIPGEEVERLRAMEITGYAYPYIEEYVLGEALPYIEEILIFSYGFTVWGELVPPQFDDLWLIEKAWGSQTEPMLVLTPFSNGRFNNYLVKRVSEDMGVRANLISNLLFTVQDRGYAGVDVDFEYILPEDRQGYADFVRELRRVMNENGYKVSVALVPKTSADQPGLLYEGMDYRMLGESADTVFLMTYEWGYTYGPPMAVAPIDAVRKVLDYAVTEIPRWKIIMGIPNYGYDWPLPYRRGVTSARLIGNVEAVRIAANYGARIQYDYTAQSPFFTYTLNGTAHEVWFEDVRSIRAKLLLADEYGFLGAGYWNLMRPFRANWLLIGEMMGTGYF